MMKHKKVKKQTLSCLLSYYKPYKGLFFADLFFAVVGAGVTLVIPLIVRYITSTVVFFVPNEAMRMIVKLGVLMVALVVVECFCNIFIAYYGHIMGAHIEANMREEIFGHYQKLSFAFFDNQKVGYLLSRVTSDLFDISELLHHGPEDLLISIIKFVGGMSILIAINPKLALVGTAFIPLIVVYAIYFNRKMKKAFRKNRERIGQLNSQIEDNLSGIKVVKSFANEAIEMKKFSVGNSKFVDSKRESYRYMGAYHSGLNAMTTLVTVCVIMAGGMYMVEGSINVTDLITFMLYINNFVEPIKKLINFTEQFQNGYSGFERFREILDIEPDITDKENAIEVASLEGNVEFHDVSFKYGVHAVRDLMNQNVKSSEQKGEEAIVGQEEKVLNHIDLQVAAGEYVAIVGTSGVGKTTLCSLIPRFYDVTDGCITIDGIDIRDMTLNSLRNHIGIVQQDVYLFAGNIMDNIRYGRPDASDEEVIEAARKANAHEFIHAFPDGYDTDIGQRGLKLSGGQKQRLAIARVFLKNPSILIFDEATSALDNESEKVVQDSMEQLAANRTTFVIAHRLSTIRNAKRILVLTDHGIAEEGTHKELLEQDGIYKHLYEMQFEGV
ncbi:MAG TPA: ABC transporter ATP-binding protein [Lachnospiraceae bacterium]|nr:ABC transporter ATP-binding protein [Lachnospiraceae bacterium]